MVTVPLYDPGESAARFELVDRVRGVDPTVPPVVYPLLIRSHPLELFAVAV
jgi:hypothetical protein